MSAIISREERPWGTFEVLSVFKEDGGGVGKDVVIKKIVVYPGKRLSLQSHRGRDENWFFVSGRGEAVVGSQNIHIEGQKSIFVPRETKHRISNIDSSSPLVCIEISLGDFDENDILRYEDDFERA